MQAQNPVQPSGERRTAHGGEQRLPRQSIMFQAASRAIKFNRHGDTGGQTRGNAKEEPKADAVSDAEQNRVSYRASKQPQRPVPPAEKIVGKIKAPQHIKASANNADGRDRVMAHPRILPAEV